MEKYLSKFARNISWPISIEPILLNMDSKILKTRYQIPKKNKVNTFFFHLRSER